MKKKILVACHELSMCGGMLRFERFGREILKHGHELTYLIFGDGSNDQYQTQFQCLSFYEAKDLDWDITMIPGQGFPDTTKQAFSKLTSDNFGLRVQHILNDRTFEAGFLVVNQYFKPDIAVFNNCHWEPGSFTNFQARKFYFLEGAVDFDQFAPLAETEKTITPTKKKWVLGTQGKPQPLTAILGSLDLLPENVELRVFGTPPQIERRHQDLISSGKVQPVGLLNEPELATFYHGCDCIIHAESFAGWANMAAEAMACGTPVICTKHGTLAFAEHKETAWVIDAPTPEVISDAVLAMFSNDQLRSQMVIRARDRIGGFSWERYASDMMSLCDDDDAAHYTYAPELGLHGKWPLDSRLEGIADVLEECAGKTILDLGCAEGAIARSFMENGAASVHGFEYDETRVLDARNRCKDFQGATFRVSDLSDWPRFIEKNADILLEHYDIVLYLGLHHHLPPGKRKDILMAASSLADKCLVIRTPNALWEQDDLGKSIKEQGFKVERQSDATLATQGSLGVCWRRP